MNSGAALTTVRLNLQPSTFNLLTFNLLSDQLDNCHFRIIATTPHGSQNAGISAVAIAIPLFNSLKQGMNQLLVVNITQSLTTGCQGTLFRQGNHFFHLRPNRFRSNFGCCDSPMTNQFGCQGSQQSLPLVSGLSQ